MKTIKIYNTLLAQCASNEYDFHCPADDWAEELENALAVEMDEDWNLADYTDKDMPYSKKLHSINISTTWIKGKLHGLATCAVDDDWNEEDTAHLIEYLIGQYADGWGEGFEQREIASYTDEDYCEESYEDEETGEFIYENVPYDVTYYVYVSFWQSENFRIWAE